MNKLNYKGPVVFVVMDGVGLAADTPGNAVAKARTPFLAASIKKHLHLSLNASGEAVGLLPGVMGNSEVGHNTMGCGQVIKQGIAQIKDAFDSGDIWQSAAWKKAISKVVGPENLDEEDSLSDEVVHTLHFSGIFSDGAVHGDINYLEAMIEKAYEEGVRRIRIHPLFDGRDVPPQSEPKYIHRIEEFAQKFSDADIKIASGGGRMTTTADRYENDWDMVERGWNMMVHGLSQNKFRSAAEAIEHFRAIDPEIQDQNLPDFVVVDEHDEPIGKVEKGDAFIYTDFRADRAIEIARAFDERDFSKFNRGNSYIADDVFFSGLTEYNADEHIPKNQLIKPNYITHPLNEFLNSKGITEYAISETVKFGHITYYFNGNSNEKSPLEMNVEIPSNKESFDTCPWMKSAEITDQLIENLDKYQFLRVNYPNGDMVGHFGEIEPTILAVDAVDLSLARLAKKVDELGGCLVITADHGNAEELIDENGIPKTSHTTNKVPFVIYDNTENRDKYIVNEAVKNPGLANIAATLSLLLGQDDYPNVWQDSLIVLK